MLVHSQKPIRLRVYTPLIFSHPSIKQKLVIPTGMNEIAWNYTMNVNVTPTYGGEVGQVLSTYVDQMTLTGQTTDNEQLKAIYEWFLHYMNLAGLKNRNEAAIHFQYPERGWSFWIQVTNLSGFTIGTGKIATPWSITCQLLTDRDLNYLSAHTMSAMHMANFDPSFYDIGFNPNDPRNAPQPGAKTGGENFAANFQSLLGAWATGDFAHWGFNVLSDASTNKLNPDAASYFQKAFGTNYVAGRPADGGSTGSATYGGGANPTGDVNVAGMINDIFEAAGVPGELGVAVSIIESGLNANSRQSGGPGIGLFQASGDGSGRVNVNYGHYTELRKAFINTGQAVTKYYSAVDQAQDAAGWFAGYKTGNLADWAYNAQKPADEAGYKAKFNSTLPHAKDLIAQYKKGAGKGAAAAQKALTQLGKPYVWGGESTRLGFDCSGLCQWAYAQVGVSIPRVSQDQQKFGSAVGLNQLQPGDLLFLGNPAYHVVMYIGGNQVVAAPHTGTVVQKEPITDFTQASDFGGARRMVS